MANKRVLIVGSAEQSRGGVAEVIRQIKKMPVWQNYHCHWLGTQIQRNYAWKLWYAVKANILALFIIWRYDIVHFHSVPDKPDLLIKLPIFMLALLGRKRIIIHIHVGNQLVNHSQNRLFKWYLCRANLIILLAKKWQALFQEQYTDVKTPTTVLYNACEEVLEVPFEEKEKIIIMAALFNDNKAPDLLLKAWQKIGRNYPDWKIYMLGNGEVERFRKMADEMGLTDTVTFTGYLTGDAKESILRKASICCICSYEEGFPMVALEAWTHGICLVTTPVGGLPEVLEEGKNALMFGFGDYERLACHLECLIKDEVLRKEMTEYSRKCVNNYFSVNIVNIQISKIYQSK